MNALQKLSQQSPMLLAGSLAAVLLSGCLNGTASEPKEMASTAAKPAASESTSSSSTGASAELVEIKLVDTIDEDRGYCLDIAGGKGERAPLDRGLQAHTCYDYTGELLVDQVFDTALMKQGQFKIPHFDVCMTASSVAQGAGIELASCSGADTQKFSLESNGQLIASTKPELCVTVSSTEKREGRGSSPVHVMRPLSLQPCADSTKAYQTWTTFKF